MYDTHFFIVTKLMLNQYLKTTMYGIIIVKKTTGKHDISVNIFV